MNKLKVLFLIISIGITGFEAQIEKKDGFVFLKLYNDGRFVFEGEGKLFKPTSFDTYSRLERLSSGIYLTKERSIDFYSYRNFRKSFFTVSFERSSDLKIKVLADSSIFPLFMNIRDKIIKIESNDELNNQSYSVGDKIALIKSGIEPRMIMLDSVGTYKLELVRNFPLGSNTGFDSSFEDIFYGTIKDSIIEISVGQVLYKLKLIESSEEKKAYRGNKIFP